MMGEQRMVGEVAIYSATIDFSYNQFHVFDSSVKLPGCAWTEEHHNQGFARQEKNVCFGTMLEFGYGDVTVHLGVYEGKDDHERVIEVPIEVPSGEVVIGGPEEYPNKYIVKIPKGHYRLVAAQTVTDDDREAIDLYFEKLAERLAKSRVVVADGGLRPPSPLVESAETA
jgi:hypothetical protein